MGNRGLANRALYHARILLDAWPQAASAAANPAAVDAAFLDASRQQLLLAYGWYLLAVSGADGEPDSRRLPGAVSDLPAPEPGRALAPELQEFSLLERDGWLSALLRVPQAATALPSGSLATDRPTLDRSDLLGWMDALQSTMARMDDSLNEC